MKSIENIFSFIIENIKKSIEEDWEKAILEINVSDNFSSFKGGYFVNGVKKKIRVSRFNPQIDLDLIDLHKITTSITHEVEKWNIALFTVTKNGNYSVEYIWSQELFDSVYKKST